MPRKRRWIRPEHNHRHRWASLDGLAGLISDIARADVADGVTLIPALPRQDLQTLGRDVLHLLAARDQPRAS
jgi:hypothetical protein